MLLVFTFLCTTNQTNDLTLKGTWDFQTKLVGKVGYESKRWDKTKKKDLTVNNLKEDKNQVLTSRIDGVKCKQVREDMRLSNSSISELERL